MIPIKAPMFTDAQKAFIIKQGEEGKIVTEVCRAAGFSRRRISTGRKSILACCRRRCAGLAIVEDENNRLKMIVADMTLDRETLQDVIK